MAETKPFWMDEEEWEKRYPKIPEQDMSDAVINGVPDLREVKKGDIVGAWTRKDGALIYHFYHTGRKAIYDQANAEMDAVRDGEGTQQEKIARQNEIAARANIEIEKFPWWDGFEQLLNKVFSDYFKYRPHKVAFSPEVDSWSVMVPDISSPVSWTDNQYEKPFNLVASAVAG